MTIVTAPEKIFKQPGETLTLGMDFSNRLTTGETLTGTPTITVVFEGTGLAGDVTATGEVIAGDNVTAKYAAGADGQMYRIQITVSTSNSNVLIGDGILRVEDK